MNSLNLFTAKELKNAGMQLAIEHAEIKHEGWGEQALDLLKEFIHYRTTPFMCEEARLYAEAKGLPKAPSARAWGGVIVLAKNQSLIVHAGYGTTTNPRAHGTPASLWVVV